MPLSSSSPLLLLLLLLPLLSFSLEPHHVLAHKNDELEQASRTRARTRLIHEKTNKAMAKIEQLRSMKKKGTVMEEDQEALSLIASLQHDLQHLLRLRFGKNVEEIQLEMTLSFPSSMPDYAQQGSEGKIIIQMADYNYAPYNVYYFLELVHNMRSADFRRNAGHVLQARMQLDFSGENADEVTILNQGMAFQEYHPENPHKKHTLGFAGRPGGPEFYINIVDNTRNHGPGSQGSRTEADGCFAKVISGFDVIERIKKQPGAEGGLGFVQQAHFIHIDSIKLLTPDG